MSIVYAAALAIVNAFWVFLNVFGLPGNWLIVATAALVWWISVGTSDEGGLFHWGWLAGLLALALLGEFLEFWLGAAGAGKAGGSKRGAVGAILGSIVGAILGSPIAPIIGTIFGACVGAFAGALLFELWKGHSIFKATEIGTGAAKGRFWGTIAKLFVGGLMWVAALLAACWSMIIQAGTD